MSPARFYWNDALAYKLANVIPQQAHAEAAALTAKVGAQVAGVESGALRDDIANPKFQGPGIAQLGSDLPYARRHNFEHNNFLGAMLGVYQGIMFFSLRKRYPG